MATQKDHKRQTARLNPPGPGPREYRDYLRAIWVGVNLRAVNQSTFTEAEVLRQLRNRLHQDFTTTDTARLPANEILIPIVTEILTAPAAGQFGFGIAPDAITPRLPAQSARQYLDQLIGLAEISATEFGNRYRLDLTRADSVLTDRVWQNIDTLRAFFRDSFQSAPDPAPTDPNPLNQPIIPTVLYGKAVFFLQYEEWLRRREAFQPENFVQIRPVFRLGATAEQRTRVRELAQSGPEEYRADWRWYVRLFDIEDRMTAGYDAQDKGEYGIALRQYRDAEWMVAELLVDEGTRVDDSGYPAAFTERKRLPATNVAEVAALATEWQASSIVDYLVWMHGNLDNSVWALIYLATYGLPVAIGDAALALGDYPTAVRRYGLTTRWHVGMASADGEDLAKPHGYRPYTLGQFFTVYCAGDLPYTVRVGPGEHDGHPARFDDDSFYFVTTSVLDILSNELVRTHTHSAEAGQFRLRQGAAVLEWADALYRTDEPDSIARARELYKAAFIIHNEDPPISPRWPDFVPLPPYKHPPAVRAQLAHGLLGLTQIDLGLNFFGGSDTSIPALRYRTLADAAAKFAASAKATAQDLTAAISRIEDGIVTTLEQSAALRRAGLQARIADEQSAIAESQERAARLQVDGVLATIIAKQQEIADHDSLTGQFGDYAKGLMDMVKGAPDDTKSAFGSSYKAEFGAGRMTGAGMLGLGSAATVTAGIGVFFAVSYITLSGMADAQKRRSADLATLNTRVLPAAEALRGAAGNAVTIARLQHTIAEADAQLATALLVFGNQRFLNTEFWVGFAGVLRRVLYRTLQLGTRFAWLAERALAYELDQPLNIMRLDYFPVREQGIGGADRLLLDLAEMETARLDAVRATVPIQHTFSLARDFPLQYGQLKATGRTTFATTSQALRQGYPGTYQHRVRALTPTVTTTPSTGAIRGILRNNGISVVNLLGADGTEQPATLVRSADALPVSEFRMRDDLAVHGLPDEALLLFEGSGMDTTWTLELPAAANPGGLGGIVDVLLTFDLRARYSPVLHDTHVSNAPTTVERGLLLSAARLDPAGLANLQGPAGSSTITFPAGTLGLPQGESGRRVTNLAVMFVGVRGPAFTASLKIAPSARTTFVVKDGVHASDAPPFIRPPGTPPSPLNLFVGADVDQSFELRITPGTSGVSFSDVKDVLLGIDYHADLH
jgi:hypothetical protein